MPTREDVRRSFALLLGRDPGDDEFEHFFGYVTGEGFTDRQVLHAMMSTAEFVHRDVGDPMPAHLFVIHRARVALMTTMLPPARHILDLGGANAPLCDAGYPHPFEALTIVDLPPEDRHEEFAGRIVSDRESHLGPVRVAYTSMTDLSIFPDGSIDLVWSGQSVEHITVDQAREMYAEVRRVLSPDGWFCLDTPNRLVTRIHAGRDFIHPDHKHEYTPAELVHELGLGGFDVVSSLGVCDMPLTVSSGVIDYRDFLVGAGVTRSVDSSYIQFHACRPVRGG